MPWIPSGTLPSPLAPVPAEPGKKELAEQPERGTRRAALSFGPTSRLPTRSQSSGIPLKKTAAFNRAISCEPHLQEGADGQTFAWVDRTHSLDGTPHDSPT
jgi:hypothetical protein